MCQASIYHFNGYCFNKSLVPEGQIAIRVEECERIHQQRAKQAKQRTIIIKN